MNEDQIKILQNKLQILACFEIDGITDLMEEIFKVCDGKSFVTVMYAFFGILAENVSDQDEEVKKQSIEHMPNLLRKTLQAFLENQKDD